jgi:hypothetical protein
MDLEGLVRCGWTLGAVGGKIIDSTALWPIGHNQKGELRRLSLCHGDRVQPHSLWLKLQ